MITAKPSIEDHLVEYHDLDPATVPASPDRVQVCAARAKARGIIIKNLMAEARIRTAEDLLAALHERKEYVQANIRVKAANSLGTLSGNLVAQAALAFLKAELPVLKAVTTDFSTEGVRFNQPVYTRIVSQPAIQSYSTASGYAPTASVDTDVEVTINQHRYAQIQYNANEVASTNRNLFAEQATAAVYALAEDMVLAIYALLTTANYTNSTTVALGSFTRAAGPIAIGTALTNRKVPIRGRSLILTPAYYGQLMSDSSIVSFESFQMGQGIKEFVLPRISGFDILPAADLPGDSENLVGVGFVKEALVAATRLPNDYSTVQQGSNYGNVSQITDPDTGLSLLLTQYVNHDQGASNWRVALMYGVAVGDATRAQLLIS